jgi:hypothetical protein
MLVAAARQKVWPFVAYWCIACAQGVPQGVSSVYPVCIQRVSSVYPACIQCAACTLAAKLASLVACASAPFNHQDPGPCSAGASFCKHARLANPRPSWLGCLFRPRCVCIPPSPPVAPRGLVALIGKVRDMRRSRDFRNLIDVICGGMIWLTASPKHAKFEIPLQSAWRGWRYGAATVRLARRSS